MALTPRNENVTSEAKDLVLKWLLKHGASIETPHQQWAISPLQEASRNGNEAAVRVLLGAGADMNLCASPYCTPLMAAAGNGEEEMVRMLLDLGADVHIQGGRLVNALTAASSGGYDRIVKILLDVGAQAHIPGGRNMALHRAAFRGYSSIVEMLLHAGADANAYQERESALTLAALQGHEKIVRLLLGAGADVHFRDWIYGNALMAAMKSGNQKIIELLTDAGAEEDPSTEEFYNRDSLLVATYACDDELVSILLQERFPDIGTRRQIEKLRAVILEMNADGRALIDIFGIRRFQIVDRFREIGLDFE